MDTLSSGTQLTDLDAAIELLTQAATRTEAINAVRAARSAVLAIVQGVPVPPASQSR